MDRQSRGDPAGPEARKRAKGRVCEGDVPCNVSSDMDTRGHEGDLTAPSVIKFPCLFVLCLGVVISTIPRITGATLDTSRLSDTLHTVNTWFAGGDPSPVLFLRLARLERKLGMGRVPKCHVYLMNRRNLGEKCITLT